MNENFVAFGSGNLYPESREKIMPETGAVHTEGDKESKKTPATNGETQKKESKAEERRRAQERDREQRRRDLEGGQGETAQKPKAEISFKDAKDVAKLITAIQDEKQVVVSPEEFGELKQVLVKAGYELKQVGRMTDAQIVLVAQQVLKNAKVAQAKESDWQYAKNSPNRKAEEALVREQIKKAQSLDEEQLTPGKVAQFLEVEEFGEAAEGGAPGAMEAEPGDEEMQIGQVPLPDFREATRETIARLKLLARRRLTVLAAGEQLTDGEQQQWQLRLNEFREAISEFDTAVREKRFLKVYDFLKTIEDAVYTSKNYEPPLPDGRDAINVLDSFLPQPERQRFERELSRLDKDFERVYMKMDDRVRKIILEDLELSLATQLHGLRSGWYRPENVRNYIFGGKYDLYDNQGNLVREGIVTSGIIHKVSMVVEQSLGEEMVGLREWRATKEIYGVEESVNIEFLTQPPARWQEVPERITAIYRFIERTDFTVEQLQEYIGKAVRMIESIKTDEPEGRRILNELNAELKAFQAFHSFRVTLERTSMDPEQVMSVFRNYFDDRTWVNFAKRFDHDSRLRDFIGVNEKGEKIKINLLDEAWKLYMKQLEDDRVRMNAIEKWTRDGEEIDLNNLNQYTEDQLWIILALAHRRDFIDYEDFNKLALETREDYLKAINNLTEERKKLLKVWCKDLGQDNSRTEFVIGDWYRRRTLAGVHDWVAWEGTEKDAKGNRIKYEVNLLTMRREQMRESLKAKLKELKLGVEGQEKTEKLLKELDQQGFLDAVDANTYQLAWSLAWSDFDMIRIYGRDRKTGKASEIPQAVAYNQFTKMFHGRMIDHFMDFIIDEERGRPYEVNEVNALFRKHLLGEHGNLFPQNRTMVRFARNFMTPRQLIEVDRRAQELMRIHNFVPDASYNELLKKDLAQERIDHPENPQRDPYFEGFLGWARSAAIAEMIDSGELGTKDEFFSFSQRGFSQVARFIDQYSMIDLYDDRVQTKKYFDRKNLQGYMRDPSTERFLRINDKDSEFYSGRNVRLWPWMSLAWRAHWEIQSKHMHRLFNKPNMSSASGETILDGLVAAGNMGRKQSEKEKRMGLGFDELGGQIKIGEFVLFNGKEFKMNIPGFFGTTPFRRARQAMEATRRLGWQGRFLLFVAFLAGLWEGIVELAKQLPKQTVEGLGGGRSS